ncbi:transposase [Bradyrhizobium nitroreducens]|uniref:Transposase n=1 Tax=Bradyrhizobium nitroreducens TaxID=709803 RepID=A0A2M6U9P7_9BRAD|nr:IS3 family transposase [Bradyrhizobium nitroreducens]PIS99316.1 transposase [Bradyrhizobium nitroreducens]PIT01277.1 transposase [Bradyrhizobium nitroreducens]PIT03105.1 transposase [Bradyrhizobium nitroreducens]
MTMETTDSYADVQRLCRLAGLPRATYYRHLARHDPKAADCELRDVIQRICLKHVFYGYRRVTAALRRQGMVVNAKKVQRLMREDNLLAQRKTPFLKPPSERPSGFLVVPNLVRGLVPSAPDQIWVADITYVHLARTFAYLAVILDAFSRKAVGWAFDDTLDTSLAISALEKAIAARRPARGSLIHHSDRGVQYASIAYRQRLADRDITLSMSRPGNPFDNAKAESFMKTLKAEEINGKTFVDLDDARRRINSFIAEVYNKERLHSALGYQSPLEFETAFAQNKAR